MTAFSQVDPVMAAVRAAEASRRAVEVFLSERPELQVARPPVSTPGGVAVVTVGDVDGLADWLAACGGTIRRGTPDDGVQTWQLYTSLPRADGSRVPVRVVTAAAEDVPVADEVLSAVVSGGPRVTAQGPLAPERFAEIRARVEADYPTVCTGCGHGRLVHKVPAPHRCHQAPVTDDCFRILCSCPGWSHPYLPAKGYSPRQDRRDALALLDEVARLAEVERQARADQADRHDDLVHALGRDDAGLGWDELISIAASAAQAESESQVRAKALGEELASYRALELGTPDGRVSARCPDPGHPAWLRDLDDTRGCPWCRVAELEKRAAQTRADVLREAVESESEGQVRARALREGAAEVRARCLSVPGRCGCHTAAALLEATARADGTGLLHCETPARGDTITERGHQMACTPPVLPWAHRLGEDGLAAFLLDLAAAAGGYWQHDGHAEVLTRIEQVFAEHRAALAGDKPDACGHDAQDRCENCRCCHACPGTVCELCSVCWCECRCVPPTSDDRRGDDR